MPTQKTPITVAEGNGIGPEIMTAVLHILQESDAQLEIKKVEIGEKVYLEGQPTGIDPSTWETIRHTAAFLKGPITTPQGGGFKSLNVTIRTTLGLYANVRPCVSYYPFVETKHPNMNVVIIRENEEDLYTGIEYRQTPEVYEALKIITQPGCEKIIRYAFEYAQAHQRKKVTCFTKDNILKLSDGLFHKIFDEIGKEYPHIEKEHWIIDIGTAKLADTPTIFDVIVLPNLYGDILSDVAAQIAGSVGLAGSANIGVQRAMFEAIHGTAPQFAGQNYANPSGLLLAAVLMLVHIGQPEVAAQIHNAWLKTIEEGIHTADIFKENISNIKVGTKEFAEAVIQRLGQYPHTLPRVHYTKSPKSSDMIEAVRINQTNSLTKKELVGVDIFIQWNHSVHELANQLNHLPNQSLKLSMISNRGVKVWPDKHPETFCVDSWRCRFTHQKKNTLITYEEVINLLIALTKKRLDCLQIHNLYTFNGQPGYTLAQEEQ